MKRALQDYRVLLLDQRGTGPLDAGRPGCPGLTAEEQARYLTHFRADSIVRDAELDPRGSSASIAGASSARASAASRR